MKTSLDIDPEIWQRVRVLAALRNISLSEVVNDALKEWLAQRKAELTGISEWVRSEIREENEPEVAKRVRDVQQRAYAREHAEVSKGRTKSKTRKGGDRR